VPSLISKGILWYYVCPFIISKKDLIFQKLLTMFIESVHQLMLFFYMDFLSLLYEVAITLYLKRVEELKHVLSISIYKLL